MISDTSRKHFQGVSMEYPFPWSFGNGNGNLREVSMHHRFSVVKEEGKQKT